MKDSQRYNAKIVEWSELDGQSTSEGLPRTFYGGCHGDDEVEVFRKLLRPGRGHHRGASRGWQPAAPSDIRVGKWPTYRA